MRLFIKIKKPNIVKRNKTKQKTQCDKRQPNKTQNKDTKITK